MRCAREGEEWAVGMAHGSTRPPDHAAAEGKVKLANLANLAKVVMAVKLSNLLNLLKLLNF